MEKKPYDHEDMMKASMRKHMKTKSENERMKKEAMKMRDKDAKRY